MSTKAIHPEFKAGHEQSLRHFEILLQSGKKITQEDIDTERSHWGSLPVQDVSPVAVDTRNIASNTAQLREFKKELQAIPEAIGTMNASLATIGLKVVPIQ